MQPEDSSHDAAAHRRVAELEAENARLRDSLAAAEVTGRHLLHELQHRVRNTLAVVRSIARRTASNSKTVEDYAMHLDGRLDAIARVGAMTARTPAGDAGFEDLLLEEMLAHAAHEDDQVSLSGPPVRLRGKAGEVVALALHELTVNAVKFGALSTPGGRIAVTWRIEPAQGADAGADRTQAGRVLVLEWRETGGPPLPDGPPRRKGFGTEMIERTLGYELGATASLRFSPEGLCCTVALPLTPATVAAASATGRP